MKRIPSMMIVALVALALASCQGDPGAMGPMGPPGAAGLNDSIVVTFVGTSPVVRADGQSSFELTAHVGTRAGQNVLEFDVSFVLASGGGSISPATAKTDVLGEARTTYTSGTTGGDVVVAATIKNGPYVLSHARSFYVDPPEMSLPLLDNDFNVPLRGSWSPDGSVVLFDTEVGNSLFKVTATGGTAELVSPLRGGIWNPDGSNRIVVHDIDSVAVVDVDGNILAGPMRPVPMGLYGDIRSAGWTGDGVDIVVASNTNASIYVMDLSGFTSQYFDGPAWAFLQWPVSGTRNILVEGPDHNEKRGIYSLNVDSGGSVLLFQDPTGYWEDGPEVRGLSASFDGLNALFAMRPQTPDGWDDQHDIVEVPTTGGQVVPLFETSVNEMYPALSPDGSKLLFTSDRSGTGFNLYVLDLN